MPGLPLSTRLTVASLTPTYLATSASRRVILAILVHEVRNNLHKATSGTSAAFAAPRWKPRAATGHPRRRALLRVDRDRERGRAVLDVDRVVGEDQMVEGGRADRRTLTGFG